jgi:hypothetical protein
MAWMGGRGAATVALAFALAACTATPIASPATASLPPPTGPGGTPSNQPTPATSRPVALGPVVLTIVDEVRVRSRPEISAESERLEPLLPRGTELFVLDGPVQASGYDWYEIAPVSLTQAGPMGWVAKGSRDGIPWLETGSATCPAAPTTVSALLAFTPGRRLACLSRHSITVRGKFVGCQCEIDGPPTNPSWFGVSELKFLVDPLRSGPLGDVTEDALWVVLDPAGTYPDPVPMGRVLDVTGMFDHPAAAACTTSDGPLVERTSSCRFSFAVSSIVPPG